MAEYKTVEVIGVGSELRGQQYLERLLADGWQILDERYEPDGVDGDGYERSITHYTLVR